MELTDLQSSENFKSKFLAYYILGFYKNYMLPSKWFSNLITHTQQEVNMFGAIYHCE